MNIDKLVRALSETLYVAAIILFLAWIFTDLSGWYWFWALMGGTFFEELN